MAIAPSDNNSSSTTPGTSTSHNQQQQQQQITSSENNNTNNNKKLVNEMVGGCSVCSDDQGTEENPLVYCDGCEVAVHQACYGIVNVPSGSWFCRKCESGDGNLKIKCELCPSKEGALKRTETGDWAHVVCALYIPEVRFGNNNTMEPIEIKHILAERYAKSCYLCIKTGNLATVNYGAVMNCHKPGCKQSFHVTCAQTAGLLCEEAGQGSDNVIYCGYCKHHFRKLKEVAGSSRKTGNKSSSYNSASSYSDSASDSSQDNDTRCNTTTDYDKTNLKTNNNSKQNILPTNLSITDGLANDFLNTKTTTISSHQNTANTSSTKVSNSILNNGPITLTIPSNNTSNKNLTSPSSSSTSSAKDGITKRKRAPKINSSNSSDHSSGSIGVASATNSPLSTLPTTGILSNPMSSQLTINPSQSSNIVSKNMSNHNNNLNDMSFVQEDAKLKEKSPLTAANKNNKNVNKKNKTTNPATPTSTTITSSTQAKQQPASSNTKLINPTTNNKDLNKISSPNLSLSTSPSLASPSNSAKSISNSSTSSITTTTASSCSSTSNSPSPALLSPNITNNQRGSAVRIESPLASKSKTGINSNSSSSYKTIPEPTSSNVASSTECPSSVLTNNPKGTKTNIQHKNDLKKNNPLGSSSLLSTALPMTNDLLASQSTASLPTIDFSGLVGENMLQPSGSSKDSSTLMKNKQGPILNSLPTVPPLIIPVPQTSINNEQQQKTTAKTSKTGAKGAGSRKKSIETNDNPKPEPKIKSSRTTKKNALTPTATPTVSANNPSVPSGSSTKPPTDTPKRGKGRAAAAKQSNNSISEQPMATTAPSSNRKQSPSTSPGKRKSKSISNESTSSPAPTPAKRQRKKKSDQQSAQSLQTTESLASINTQIKPPSLAPLNSQFLTNRPPSNSSGAILGAGGGGPLMVNTPIPNNRLLSQGFNTNENHEVGGHNNKYFSPMISPYAANYDNLSVPSLSRASLSRLFTTSSTDINNVTSNNLQDDPAKAFDELRDNTWSNLSKCILEQAQQFDIPSLIGTLYTLRSENDKLVNRVRELTMKRNELVAINARLDLTGPMLTQHLNNTSPNFSSVVSGLTNSPKSLPASSPGSAIGSKQSVAPPPNPLASYNHVQPGNTLGPPSYLDSNSPMVSQTHSGINNIKTSSISTPSPPISALMAHSNSNRAGLITINPPYMPNVFPPMSTLAQLGTTPQSSSYYSRQ